MESAAARTLESHVGAGDMPAGRDEAQDILEALDAVIAEVEGAEAGGPRLDARIHFGFRVMADQSPDVAGLLIGEGIPWPTVRVAVEETIPPYSTSLDAALDGERIVFILHSAKRRRWCAMQRAKCGEEILAWAATEALARRLAALKNWRADLAASMKDRDSPGASCGDRTGPSLATLRAAELGSGDDRVTHGKNPGETGKAEREKDWEVLF